MKKIILILSLFIFLFSFHIQLFAQDIETIKDELNKSIGSNKFLKDFTFKIESNSVAKYSIVLSKNSKYEFAVFQNEPNQFSFELYNDKLDINLLQSKVELTKQIIKAEFINGETGVYHLIIKNNSNKALPKCLPIR